MSEQRQKPADLIAASYSDRPLVADVKTNAGVGRYRPLKFSMSRQLLSTRESLKAAQEPTSHLIGVASGGKNQVVDKLHSAISNERRRFYSGEGFR